MKAGLLDASAGEDDAGTQYVATIFDSNGNYMSIVYEPGAGSPDRRLRPNYDRGDRLGTGERLRIGTLTATYQVSGGTSSSQTTFQIVPLRAISLGDIL
jgi:hypothetical protein